MGSVILMAYGFGRWDLLKTIVETGPLDSILKAVIALIIAYVIGIVIRSALTPPLDLLQ